MAESKVKLREYLIKRNSSNEDFSRELQWLESVKAWIHFHCPILQLFLVKGKTVAWLVVHPCEEMLNELKTQDIRLLINVDRSYEFQVYKITVKYCEPGVLSNREHLLPHLHSFEPVLLE